MPYLEKDSSVEATTNQMVYNDPYYFMSHRSGYEPMPP